MYLSSRKIVVFSHASFYHQLFYCTFIALKNIMLHISASEKITDIPDLCFQHSFKALSKNESEGGKNATDCRLIPKTSCIFLEDSKSSLKLYIAVIILITEH